MTEYDGKNLIINYLPQELTDKEFHSIFVTIGAVKHHKLMRDMQTGYSYGYGFIRYEDPDDADKAIEQLNGLPVQHKFIKVAYARPPGEDAKDANLYVQNLPRDIDENYLTELFAPFGTIINKRLLRDKYTQKPRGVGFVRFAKRADAQKAIAELSGVVPKGGVEALDVKVAEDHTKRKQAAYQSRGGMQTGRGAGMGGGFGIRGMPRIRGTLPMGQSGATLGMGRGGMGMARGGMGMARGRMGMARGGMGMPRGAVRGGMGMARGGMATGVGRGGAGMPRGFNMGMARGNVRMAGRSMGMAGMSAASGMAAMSGMARGGAYGMTGGGMKGTLAGASQAMQGSGDYYNYDYSGYDVYGDYSSGYAVDGSTDYTADPSAGYAAGGSAGYAVDGSADYTADGSSGYAVEGSTDYTADPSVGYAVDGSAGYGADGSAAGYAADGSSGYGANQSTSYGADGSVTAPSARSSYNGNSTAYPARDVRGGRGSKMVAKTNNRFNPMAMGFY